jgi:hypothetical protein
LPGKRSKTASKGAVFSYWINHGKFLFNVRILFSFNILAVVRRIKNGFCACQHQIHGLYWKEERAFKMTSAEMHNVSAKLVLLVGRRPSGKQDWNLLCKSNCSKGLLGSA